MRTLFTILLCSLTILAMGQNPIEEGFLLAKPGYEFQFPRDHGAHENYKTEWWYFTGNMEDEQGTEFGYQFTIFRHQLLAPSANQSPTSLFTTPNIYLAHFAVSNITEQEHRHAERLARPELGQAFVSNESMNLKLNDWSVIQSADETITLIAHAKREQFSVNLTVKPNKPLVLNGTNGVHVKSSDPNQASYYYSYTNLETTGTVTWDDQAYTISGLSWMDHEFGSSWLSQNEAGWDWFAIQLNNNVDLMLYQLRTSDGSAVSNSEGTLVLADGTKYEIHHNQRTLIPTRYWKSSQTEGNYPIEWNVKIPEYNADLKIIARFPEQEMLTNQSTGSTYWEGAISASGSWLGEPVQGKGYLELVGYTGAMTPLSATPRE
ncbi:MAG: lipocalin-like domain-containing protein [Sumerlaeia bacterium]